MIHTFDQFIEAKTLVKGKFNFEIHNFVQFIEAKI